MINQKFMMTLQKRLEQEHYGLSIGDFLCMGYDESNHGRCPEIVVVTYSYNKDYLKRSKRSLNKIREEKNITIEEILHQKEIGFYFTVINNEKIINNNAIKYFCVFHSLFKYLEANDILPKKYEIIIDGQEIPKKSRKLIEKLGLSNFSFKKNADAKYVLVNTADFIAYKLYQYFVKNKKKRNVINLKEKYQKNRFELDITNEILKYLKRAPTGRFTLGYIPPSLSYFLNP